tara:strand:+ start:12956 stop:13159 length:204 start_codon:yes stop_codon:yes gene_type:complete
MLISNVSTLTGNTSEMEIDVSLTNLTDWQGGMLIQDAMPHISSGEREFIMSGITPTEWDVFAEEDDD